MVNDGSTEVEAHTGVDWWKKSKMLPIKILDMEENVGFLRASNAGIKKASGDIVVLISNDVRIQEDVITRIMYQLNMTYKSLVGGRFLDFDTGWNKFGNRIFPYLEGWLLATWKDNWQELGGFDERYSPNDYEDIDLSTSAVDKGYMLVALPEVEKLHHMAAQSIGYSSEREELTKINRKKFEEKWLRK